MKGNGFNSLKNMYSYTTPLMYLHGSNWKLLVDLFLKLEAVGLCHSHSAVSEVYFTVHLLIKIKLLILHHLYNQDAYLPKFRLGTLIFIPRVFGNISGIGSPTVYSRKIGFI